MPEFLTLLPPREARQTLLAHFHPQVQSEWAALDEALGRVSAAPLRAPHPLPEFRRATMDGYAVRAADTYGASESIPAYLLTAGEVPMGGAPAFRLARGQCALIYTGGMLPEGADAVVMVEQTQIAGRGEVEILRAAAVGENVIEAGEDVKEGEIVIPQGRRLRPAELGGLAALGLTRIPVARKPRVGILSSGDEVVRAEVRPQIGQVRDVNAHTLAGLVQQCGGEAVQCGIAPDQAEALREAARRALVDCDMLLISAGSSASGRDLTAQVIQELGAPGVLVHGVNVRPGKPTILAICDQKPVLGLPGNPVSALVVAGLFVVPLIEAQLGIQNEPPAASRPARLALNLPSQAGREDWVAVRLEASETGWLAEPVFGKSNLIFTLARANGLICIPADATGLSAGETIEVYLTRI